MEPDTLTSQHKKRPLGKNGTRISARGTAADQLLADSKKALFEAIVESDKLALAVVSSMEGYASDVWTGTASDLRKSLIYGSPSTLLPPTAAALARRDS